MPPAPTTRIIGILRALDCADFDCRSRTVMIGLLKQSKDAADWLVDSYISYTLVQKFTVYPELVQQARVVSRTDRSEMRALASYY